MRSTTMWCVRTHELAILHMRAKLLTKRKVYLRETVPSLRGGRVVVACLSWTLTTLSSATQTPSWRRQGKAPPAGTKSPLIWRFLSSRTRRSPTGTVCITYALTLIQGRHVRVLLPVRRRMRGLRRGKKVGTGIRQSRTPRLDLLPSWRRQGNAPPAGTDFALIMQNP